MILYALSKARQDIDKYFYKIKFDLTLSDFKNFDFANAKMALVSKNVKDISSSTMIRSSHQTMN